MNFRRNGNRRYNLDPDPKRGEKHQEKKLTRREFLKKTVEVLGAGSIGAIIATLLLNRIRKLKENSQKDVKSNKITEKIAKEIEKIEKNNTPYPVEDLKIENINQNILLDAYLSDNSFDALSLLWNKKIQRLEGKKPNLEEIFENLKQEGLEKLKKERGCIKNLSEFENYLHLCIFETLSIFDINKFLENKEYNSNKSQLIKKFLFKFMIILPKFLISLIITEVCYLNKDKPIENFKILSVVLRKHGLSFISFVPALYDNELSFGPFQLTPFVVNPSDEEKTYPVTYMNKNFIQEGYKLPDYLQDFQVRDHYKAGILLSLYYVSNLLKTPAILNNLETLLDKENITWFIDQIFYYLAGVHHFPSLTKRQFIEFIKSLNLNDQKVNFNNHSFLNFVDPSSHSGKYIKRFGMHYLNYEKAIETL